MIWMWDNLLEDGFTASSEQILYPAANIVDRFKSTQWKADGDTATLLISGSSIEVSGVSLLNTNLTAGATVKIQGNNTDSWGSPSFSLTLTGGETIFETFATQTYDYFRLYMEDASVVDLECGYCFIGEYFETRGISPGAEIEYNEENTQQFSRSNQIIGQTQYQYRTVSVNFPNLTNTNRLAIKAVYDVVGSVIPIVIGVWGDDHEAPIFAIMERPRFTSTSNAKWTGSISFREVG